MKPRNRHAVFLSMLPRPLFCEALQKKRSRKKHFRRRFLTNPFLLKAVGKAFTEKAFPPVLLHRAAACKAAVVERAVSAGRGLSEANAAVTGKGLAEIGGGGLWEPYHKFLREVFFTRGV